jgi:tRNA(Arg) A34 adenosine deaminase TadA
MNYMNEAIAEAYSGIKNGHGGPFGSVVVKNGQIIGRGHNRVLYKKDPTCHGEMEAIRDACKNLGTHDLSGCELYTTAEPCPMCLGGILWANIKSVYYGCNRTDTDAIGFRDNVFYEYLRGNTDLLHMEEHRRMECLALFHAYEKEKGNERY